MTDTQTIERRSERPEGDDVIIPVRVRRANLPALEAGVHLGWDALTGGAIRLRLELVEGAHNLEVVTNPLALHGTPEPVEPQPVEPQPGLPAAAVVLTRRQVSTLHSLPERPHVVALVQDPERTDVIVCVADGRRWRIEVDGTVEVVERGEPGEPQAGPRDLLATVADFEQLKRRTARISQTTPEARAVDEDDVRALEALLAGTRIDPQQAHAVAVWVAKSAEEAIERALATQWDRRILRAALVSVWMDGLALGARHVLREATVDA